jgi:hypothetical protein
MIFVGDIALPFKDAIKSKGLPPSLNSKQWIGNLEGALIDSEEVTNKSNVVFNSKTAVKTLC